MDKNKLMLKSNSYNENFSGQNAPVVQLRGIRKVYIDDDTYTGNAGQFKEALDKYGTISTSGDTSDTSAMPGAIPFSSYYVDSDVESSLEFNVANVDLQKYYPGEPLEIDTSFYISLTGVTFDNNYKQELHSSIVTTVYPSEAFTIRRSQGEIHLTSLTIQNLKGIDLTKLEAILGDSYSNVVTANPTERDNSGDPNVGQENPKYTIDFAFK
jgi:hypothetical protein